MLSELTVKYIRAHFPHFCNLRNANREAEQYDKGHTVSTVQNSN